MKKIFFLGYGGGHINALMPVIKKINRHKNIEVCTVGINLAVDTLRRNGLPCKTLSSYLDEKSLKIGWPKAKKFHNFNSTVSYADSISYYGFSMGDLIDEVGEKIAEEIFRIYDRRLFLPVNTMKRILQIEKPDVVVVTTMHRFEAASIIAANELSIPTVKIEDLVGNIKMPFPDKIQVESQEEYDQLVQEGINPQKIVLKSLLNSPDIVDYRNHIFSMYNEMRPTKTCVISSFVKDKLIKKGFEEKSIVVTGQPAFDELEKISKMNSDDIKKRLKIDSKKKVISFMSQPLPNREKYLRAIISELRKIPEYQLIIKLHPNEDGKIQNLILKELGYDAIIIKNISSAELAMISDITSTVSSTTGLEAAVLDRDLIYYCFNDEEFVPFEKMNIGIKVSSKDKINTVINSVLNDNVVKEKLSIGRLDYKGNFSAASNIESVILNLIGEKR